MPTSSSFHNSPQRFNKSHQKASEATQALVALMQKGSQTLVGTIADTSFHLTQGYVTCTTQSGIVQVSGIPPGTVIPGMRVYCRRLGTYASNRSYIFDGYASTISSLGSNGSLVLGMGPTLSSGCATVTGVTATSGITTSSGYYWHCFFYFPSIPTSTATLFQFAQTGALTTTFTAQMTTSCYVQVLSSDGHGYQSNAPVSPHQLHWLVVQPGNAGNAFLLDGLPSYTNLVGSSDATFAGGTNTYSVALGTNVNGTQVLPVGAWISKMGYGTSTSLFPSTLPSGTAIPQYDTDLPNGNGSGLFTKMLYLFEDTPGSTSAINSGASSGAATLSVSSPASIAMAGPY